MWHISPMPALADGSSGRVGPASCIRFTLVRTRSPGGKNDLLNGPILLSSTQGTPSHSGGNMETNPKGLSALSDSAKPVQ